LSNLHRDAMRDGLAARPNLLMKSLQKAASSSTTTRRAILDLCWDAAAGETPVRRCSLRRLIEGARSFVERDHSRGFVDRLKRRASARFSHTQTTAGTTRASAARRFTRPAACSESHCAAHECAIGLIFFPPLKGTRAHFRRQQLFSQALTAAAVVVHHGCVAQVLANSEI